MRFNRDIKWTKPRFEARREGKELGRETGCDKKKKKKKMLWTWDDKLDVKLKQEQWNEEKQETSNEKKKSKKKMSLARR
ncbi:hypothetical protein Bca52824_057127 [Brassica carinata]|uniref:Uncharacterized protein n=1 Tax=Brassica carinata TaxID=52824 RepID=A0A8X7QRM0_BRACI|nr:hypothetical protein Bca52824_057127 [Brassica carinata]